MKKISSLVQTKTGLLALAISMALIGGTAVLGVQFVNHQIQVAQEKQRRELVQQLDNLISDAKVKYFAIGASVEVYKDMRARHEGLLSLVQLSGQQDIAQTAADVKQLAIQAQQSVEQKTAETKSAQAALQKFVATHQDYMKTVNPQVRAAVDSILELNVERDVQAQIAQQPQQQPSFFPF